jgi:hypothetical protein
MRMYHQVETRIKYFPGKSLCARFGLLQTLPVKTRYKVRHIRLGCAGSQVYELSECPLFRDETQTQVSRVQSQQICRKWTTSLLLARVSQTRSKHAFIDS